MSNSMTWEEIRQGDAVELLRAMPAESVRCCVTSPPYWGLRDYGHAGQIGLERTPDGPRPLSIAPSSAPDPERELRAKEELAELQRHFKDDDHVVLLIEGVREGMGGPEIRDKLGMSIQAYEAARKKLLRYRSKQRGR